MSIRTPESFRPRLLSCDTEENSPFSVRLVVEPKRNLFDLLKIVRTDGILRWNTTRSLTSKKGTGFEGHLLHLPPEERTKTIAKWGVESLNSFARRFRYQPPVFRELDKFIYDQHHPIISKELYDELLILFLKNLGIARAERSTNFQGINAHFMTDLYGSASRHHGYYNLHMSFDPFISWGYPQIPNDLIASLIAYADDLSTIPSTNQPVKLVEGYSFMMQIGRLGDPVGQEFLARLR